MVFLFSFKKLKQREADRLVLEITEKARGVFLWVHLVVQSLLEGMRDGDSLADLKERLSSLPFDLEELFKKILGCIDQRYLKQASRFFQLVRTASEPLSLLTFSYAEEGIDVAMCTEIEALHLGEDLEERRADRLTEKMFRAETTRRRINSRSKGLLEAPDFKHQGYKATIQYLHRTGKDFLAQDTTGEFLQSWLSDPFDADLHICTGYMVDVKSIDITPWIDPGQDLLTPNCFQGERKSWRGFLLPSSFDGPVRRISADDFWVPFQLCIEHVLRLENRERDLHIAILNEMERIGRDFFETKDGRQAWLDRSQWPSPSMPFLDYAARYLLYTWTGRRLKDLDEAELQRVGHKLLLEAACRQDIRMVKLLLEHKVDPNFRVSGETTWYYVLSKSSANGQRL